MKKSLVLVFLALLFSACANHSSENFIYEQALKNSYCNAEFFQSEQKKVDGGKDTIYIGLNVGALARSCSEFKTSNYFFDKVEDAYKFDVDLQGFGTSAGKSVAGALLNESVTDYEGTLYERIMVNVYKGLNFMSLGDFANARVEFNRALMRQDKAKEYFNAQIAANRKEFSDTNAANVNTSQIATQYNHLLKDFATTQHFTNPYATYIASVFFFLDEDYRRAADLFKEVAIINAASAEFNKEFSIFNAYANSTHPQNLPKYIFIVLESGFGAGLDEVKLSVPFGMGKGVVMTSLALPVLKKREASFGYLIANSQKTADFVDFDTIIATEFKAKLGVTIAKAVSSMVAKTAINAAVAQNDDSGLLSLVVNILNTATTTADVRFWNSLPKYAKILAIENKGSVKIHADNGNLVFESANLDKNKNVLILVRSYSRSAPSVVWVVQK